MPLAAVHIEDCMIHEFTEDGIAVDGDFTEVFIGDSTVCDNGGAGSEVFARSIVLVSNSTFIANTTGIFASGVVESPGNNIVRGNTTDTNGTITQFPRR